jgi:hypothetical protein
MELEYPNPIKNQKIPPTIYTVYYHKPLGEGGFGKIFEAKNDATG